MERVELPAKRFGPRRFVAAKAESLREKDGAAPRFGLELRSLLQKPLQLDLEVAAGVGRSRQSRNPSAELLLRGSFEIASVRSDDTSQPPKRDAKIMKSLRVLSPIEPSERGIRLLEETQT